MIQGLSLAADDINDWVWCILLLLPRLLVIMQFWPVWSDTLSSLLLKASAAMGLLALPAVHLLPHVHSLSLAEHGIFRFALTEAALGLVIGLTVALPLYAVRAFGALVDVLRGATFSVLINPASGEEELTLERLAGMGYGLWLLMTPVWLQAVELVLDSYWIWPPSAVLQVDIDAAWRSLQSLFAMHLVWALRFLAPVFVLVLLVEVALYLISGYASNIQVYSVDMALKGLVCLFMLLMLFLYSPQGNLESVEYLTRDSLERMRALMGLQ